MQKDSHIRSVLKGVSWRFVATTTTIIIAYIITGEASHALTIGGIEFVGKIFIYYLHERAWLMVPPGTFRGLIRFGKKGVPEDTSEESLELKD